MTPSFRSVSVARAVCALAVVLSLAAPAQEQQDNRRKASAAQTAAVREYEDGKYQQALEHFQEAYRLRPEPSLLLGIARARYRLKELDRAKSCLFDFLKDDPKSVYASEAFEMLTRIEKETPKAPGATPRPCVDPFNLPAGTTASGESPPDAIVVVDKSGGRTTKYDLPPAAPPAIEKKLPDATPQARARKHGPWSYGLLGASVVAAGVGTYFGTKNLSATSDWRAARTTSAMNDARTRAQDAAKSANIAWAASGALLGTGLGLFFFTEF